MESLKSVRVRRSYLNMPGIYEYDSFFKRKYRSQSRDVNSRLLPGFYELLFRRLKTVEVIIII